MHVRVFAGACALVSVIVHSSAAFAGPIEDRQALMKALGEASKHLAPIARGAAPFDPAAVGAQGKVLADVAAKLPSLFPAGSDEGATPTAAAATIWSDAAGFKAAAAKFQADVKAVAAARDATALASAFRAVSGHCVSCHRTYRTNAQ